MDWKSSPGGLVTALEPVMRAADGAWVGWAGVSRTVELEPFEYDGISLVPVPLSADELELYYEGFSNDTLWPLYHDVIAAARATTASGGTRTCASTGASPRRPRARPPTAPTVWVQDYQLQLVPRMLRELPPRPRDRLLQPHSRSRHTASTRSCRGAARCSRDCSAPT